MRTNHWRRLCVVSGAICLTVLALGIPSLFRTVFGINYGIISALLDGAIIIAAICGVLRIEYTVYSAMKCRKDHRIAKIVKKESPGEWQEAVLIPGDDGEFWILNENGMSHF